MLADNGLITNTITMLIIRPFMKTIDLTPYLPIEIVAIRENWPV